MLLWGARASDDFALADAGRDTASAYPREARPLVTDCMAIRLGALIPPFRRNLFSTLSDLERRRASARRRRVAFDCEVRANRPIGLRGK
jgi:hypothetical protein